MELPLPLRSLAAEAADGVVGELGVGEQAAELEPARTEHRIGADGVLARVHADRGADAATGNAEVQRIKAQHAGFEQEAHVHVVQRPARRLDARGPQAHSASMSELARL